MRRKWKPGDLVTVETFNRGAPLRTSNGKPAKSWAGEIVGPSVLGPGWWNVRRDPPSGGPGGSVFAVPAGEIKPRKG